MSGPHQLGPWQELWMVLAKAWLPPMTAQEQQAMGEDLSDDLRELFGLLEIGSASDAFAQLQRRLAALAGQQLLVQYSSLFLAPPVAASLNLGAYASGNGGAAFSQRGQQILQQLGLQQNEQLHDTGDHLAIQLELLAHLEVLPEQGSMLREQLARLLASVQGLHRLLQQRAADSAYLDLCQLLGAALHRRVADFPTAQPMAAAEADKRMPELPTADPHAPPLDDPQLLRAAAAHGVTAEAMQFIVDQMQAKGLGTEHLLLQAPTTPWQRMTPPTVGTTGKRQQQP